MRGGTSSNGLLRRLRAEAAAQIGAAVGLAFRLSCMGDDFGTIDRFALGIDAVDEEFGALDAAEQRQDGATLAGRDARCRA